MEEMSFGQCVKQAWISACQAVVRMPVLLVVIVAIYSVIRFVPALLFPLDQIPGTGAVVLGALINVATGIVSLPVGAVVIVKVHRFVLLGEKTLPLLADRGLPVGRYVIFAFAIGLAIMLTGLAMLGLYSISPTGARGLFMLMVYPTAIFLLVRVSLLVPAIALGSKLEWKAAWTDSQGHFWSMFGVAFVVYLPLFVALVASVPLIASAPPGASDAGALPFMATIAAVRSVITVLGLVLTASTLSWLYRWYARELPRAVVAAKDTAAR